MDINKENRICTKRQTSKIPLPQEPLPKLPKRLLEKKVMRRPLKNINHVETANSNTDGIVDKKCPLKIDTAHVTLRRTEDLDWDYKVFKDDQFALSSIADAGSSSCQDVKITPLKSLLAVNKKNIKMSLKRPHSRELQCLSPKASEQKEEKYKRQLNFKSVNELQPGDSLTRTYMTCLTEEYTADMFTHLLNTERRLSMPQMRTMPRACVINWIMKINGNCRNPEVIQSTVSYMDAVMAEKKVHLEQLQLLATACYLLAVKNHGPVIGVGGLVKASRGAFKASSLVRAERAILNILRFPTTPIVPQDFIYYLSWSCETSEPEEVEAAATFICTSALLTSKSLCNEYPSVIGAAAVRNAMIWLGRNPVKLVHNDVYHAAKSKAEDFNNVCQVQQKAVCEVSSPGWKYNAPFEKYGKHPHFIAQKIVHAATKHQLPFH